MTVITPNVKLFSKLRLVISLVSFNVNQSTLSLGDVTELVYSKSKECNVFRPISDRFLDTGEFLRQFPIQEGSKDEIVDFVHRE